MWLLPITALLLTSAAAHGAKVEQAILDSGKKLIADSKCEACHVKKVGGDGSAIYTRTDRRVTAKSKLLPQVERCSSELNLGLFPDDEAAIAAYLNATHYKFKD
ncbi:MAG: hypothetical protein JNN20_06035 [Betaproteobacteria bacterium]|nr:hypothetical protein [Betaproteobacteria bacterium]